MFDIAKYVVVRKTQKTDILQYRAISAHSFDVESHFQSFSNTEGICSSWVLGQKIACVLECSDNIIFAPLSFNQISRLSDANFLGTSKLFCASTETANLYSTQQYLFINTS